MLHYYGYNGFHPCIIVLNTEAVPAKPDGKNQYAMLTWQKPPNKYLYFDLATCFSYFIPK